MYPNFYYIFKDWFGLEIEFLKVINSFGFFVAISFLLAGIFIQKELKRKFKEGKLGAGDKIDIHTGKPFPLADYITGGLSGLLLGFKILPLLIDFRIAGGDTQSYILSSKGSLTYGIIAAAGFLIYIYRKDKKQRLPEPLTKTIEVDPSHYMGEFTFAAFVGGILGAKLFHILENLNEFNADPWGNIVSFSGLTFYGGLIVGGISVLFLAWKRGISVLHMLDAGGPAMMLAYATGRIGCQVSGDGDWGINNPDPKPGWMGIFPDWVWSYDYPNNVNSIGVPIPGCTGLDHCMHLEIPVYPTPLYETVVGLLLFLVLWMIRKRIRYSGVLFGVYMIMNGLERFFIEKIRVNTLMDFMGMKITQAELISSIFVISGIALIVYGLKRKERPAPNIQDGTGIDISQT